MHHASYIGPIHLIHHTSYSTHSYTIHLYTIHHTQWKTLEHCWTNSWEGTLIINESDRYNFSLCVENNKRRNARRNDAETETFLWNKNVHNTSAMPLFVSTICVVFVRISFSKIPRAILDRTTRFWTIKCETSGTSFRRARKTSTDTSMN